MIPQHARIPLGPTSWCGVVMLLVAHTATLGAQLNSPPRLDGLSRTLVVQGGGGAVDQERLFAVVDSLLNAAGFERENPLVLLVVGVGLTTGAGEQVVSVNVRLDESVDRRAAGADGEPIRATTWQRGEVRSYPEAGLAEAVERTVLFWVNAFIGDYRLAHPSS